MAQMCLMKMNRLTDEAVSQIKTAQGLYRAADVARAYGCHRSTVARIWDGAVHGKVTPSQDVPNVTSRNRPSELQEDIRLLLNRGMSPEDVAGTLNISTRSVYQFRGVFV